MKKAILVICAICFTAAGIAIAQPNISGSPLYGTLNLEAGFLPDPREVAVTAGGSSDASSMGLPSSCVGQISSGQPDVRLNFTAGSSPLTIKVEASIDTTLVVNGPDGSWYCNDDANGFNPAVTFRPAPSGQYDIWVGTYGSSTGPATVKITELL
jgi:hypothetical protein